MKNIFFTMIIAIIASAGSIFANKSLALYDFYVRDIDGNYKLMTAASFNFDNCYPLVEEVCAYYHFKNNIFLPNTLTSEQVDFLSNYEPITLKPVVDVVQIPIKGYYFTD